MRVFGVQLKFTASRICPQCGTQLEKKNPTDKIICPVCKWVWR